MNNGKDLPETLQAAMIYFGDEVNAFELVKSMRWPNGKVTCPRCDSGKAYFLPKAIIDERETKCRESRKRVKRQR